MLWQKQGSPPVYLTQNSRDGGVDVVALMGKGENFIQVWIMSVTMWTESKLYPIIMDSFTVKREIVR